MRRRVVACIDAQRWLRPLLDSVRRQFPARDVFVIDTVGKDVTADPDRAVLNGSDRVRASESVARLVERDALILLAATRGETTSIGEHVLLRDSPLTWSIEGSGGTKELRGRTEDEAVDRIARWLMMGSVGLALGAGGAYGFAHFGLLHVLEEAGIPIDVVTGTSMGSIAAATVATGIPSRRTIDHIHRVATRYRSIVMRDLDWWGRTLLTGAGVRRILEELDELRRATFETLLIPFEAVAMDVGNGTEVAISSGSVLDAIQASIAMPGIFPTCRRGERHLVDGAMVNPVPVDRARALGADVVVAVQPIPPLQEPRADHARSNIFNRIPLGPLRGGMDSLGTSIRSFQSLWYKLASAAALTGDIAVAPDLRAFWFLQFGAAPQLIEAGERHARQLLPEIRAALAARTGLVA
ncbi:MAG TPA: patatin-like phospholipase family protein [Candidatus Binatia bacterium]